MTNLRSWFICGPGTSAVPVPGATTRLIHRPGEVRLAKREPGEGSSDDLDESMEKLMKSRSTHALTSHSSLPAHSLRSYQSSGMEKGSMGGLLQMRKGTQAENDASDGNQRSQTGMTNVSAVNSASRNIKRGKSRSQRLSLTRLEKVKVFL